MEIINIDGMKLGLIPSYSYTRRRERHARKSTDFRNRLIVSV